MHMLQTMDIDFTGKNTKMRAKKGLYYICLKVDVVAEKATKKTKENSFIFIVQYLLFGYKNTLNMCICMRVVIDMIIVCYFRMRLFGKLPENRFVSIRRSKKIVQIIKYAIFYMAI